MNWLLVLSNLMEIQQIIGWGIERLVEIERKQALNDYLSGNESSGNARLAYVDQLLNHENVALDNKMDCILQAGLIKFYDRLEADALFEFSQGNVDRGFGIINRRKKIEQEIIDLSSLVLLVVTDIERIINRWW